MDLGESSHGQEPPSYLSVCPHGSLRILENLEANALVAFIGGAYSFTKYAAANLREKDDSINPALGGLLAGAVMGLRREDV